jgi:hypothetical protein
MAAFSGASCVFYLTFLVLLSLKLVAGSQLASWIIVLPLALILPAFWFIFALQVNFNTFADVGHFDSAHESDHEQTAYGTFP